MRAHFYSDLTVKNEYSITGDGLHHLVHVIRIDQGEELLLLDGKGQHVLTQVTMISKKEMRLAFKSSHQHQRKYEISLVLAMPKKDALELSLKQAVELGFKQIFLVKSDYSQMKFLETERLQSLLVSALEQSNAAFLPEIISAKWSEISWSNFKSILMLDSQSAPNKGSSSRPDLLIVGPEGGFSPNELEFLRSITNLTSLTLPTPIMRTPTALAVGTGIMLERLLD